jgi:hypothetical protein
MLAKVLIVLLLAIATWLCAVAPRHRTVFLPGREVGLMVRSMRNGVGQHTLASRAARCATLTVLLVAGGGFEPPTFGL